MAKNRVKKFESEEYSALNSFFDEDEERREAAEARRRALEKKRKKAEGKKKTRSASKAKFETVDGGKLAREEEEDSEQQQQSASQAVDAPAPPQQSSPPPPPASHQEDPSQEGTQQEDPPPTEDPPPQAPPKRTEVRSTGKSKPSIRVEFEDDDQMEELSEFLRRVQRKAKSKVSLAILVRNQLLLLQQAEAELADALEKYPVKKKPANYFPEELAEYEGRWLNVQDHAMRNKVPSHKA